VQIITVALDEMDRMLLRDKVRSDSAYGWVPGRSFCGRVMEVGWEVKRLRKGDMVFGLQSNRKCGALAEFMIIDQDFVAKAPEDCLTVEQIAALPATGVLTYQIVQNHCVHLPKGARILILNAHDGIGLLTMQECASLGLIMVAQCPASISDGLAVCEANGAHEVVVGEPLWAMNSLHESSFDLVIDTIGGRRLYDASRRILASEGQFVTCFGDEHTSANPNFRSHMRSLRRTFFKKDKKNLRYEWTGLENSEDCKEALENVRAVAESGDICPRLRSILPFEDAARAFDPVTRGGIEEEPGAVVVRVS
jgi:NADPH:quinone reductase-like Zn-dependent oxidoreductase